MTNRWQNKTNLPSENQQDQEKRKKKTGYAW